ncbi:MAG: hypothetical protein NC393_08150 [Clostridium sp.]|nr:hypothetical protein [Clostridium sp.]MCM1209106.1 hypothetical protein [Ruminococcus sp.]
MAEYKGIKYLRKKLEWKRERVKTRYLYYEMKNKVKYISRSIPPSLRRITSCLGWCAKSVDSLGDRLVFKGFEDDNFDLQEIYAQNNPDVLYDSAILSSLISSCCFIYISPDEDGYPRLQVIDGGNATGIIDPITGLLKEGYAVLERDKYGSPVTEAYFTAGKTQYTDKRNISKTYRNVAPYPLLVPIVYRPDAVRPFGHSRISRACIQIQQSAMSTIIRSEISAEFYSFPQKYVVGTNSDFELDKWSAAMSAMMNISKDEDGNSPSVGQFAQQSMSPYTEQLRMFAALFAGETGLTLDDLGFVSDNPSSAEAIKASHENLRLAARKAQRTFGSGFLNAGYLAACIRDEYPYERKQLYLTKPAWEPIFEPDAAMLSSIGDGAVKLNQAVPGYFNTDNLSALTGIKPSRIKEVNALDGEI